MEVRLSDNDRAMLVGQMTVINYLKAQVSKLEQEVVVACMLGYGVDVRKEGAIIDLENGVLRNGSADTTEPGPTDAPSVPSVSSDVRPEPPTTDGEV